MDRNPRQIWPCCKHCGDHSMPWDGSETLMDDGMHHTRPCQACQVATDGS